MSFLLELLFEFVLQFVLEFLVEIVSHRYKRGRAGLHPVIAVGLYALLGGGLGWVSCLVFPHHLVSFPHAAEVNLIVTPVAVGLALAAVGAWRSRRDMDLVLLDKFVCGYLFALAFAVVRFALVTSG